MALSVATGTPCLGKYAVPQAGPVLVYLAEDALPVVRERVAGMARHRGLDLAGVEVHVITAPTLRLDRDPHRGRLLETAKRLRPRLLLLDPLVRLHGIDENNAGEVAGLLAYFRSLQRQLDLSVVLVHHTRKNAGGEWPPARGCAAPATCTPSATPTSTSVGGTRLRVGSGWCCPTSTARRQPRHRSICSLWPPTPRLPIWRSWRGWRASNGGRSRSRLTLLTTGVVQSRGKLRAALAVKNERLGEALGALEQAGRVRRTPTGWQRID